MPNLISQTQNLWINKRAKPRFSVVCTLLILKESLYPVLGGSVSLLVTADDDPPTLKEKGKQRQRYRLEKKGFRSVSSM